MTRNVLFISSEAHPFVKVGGLGDVAGVLPEKLTQLSNGAYDVRLVLPYHAKIRKMNHIARHLGNFSVEAVDADVECSLFIAKVAGVTAYLIDYPTLHDEPEVYTGDAFIDGGKYAIFSVAALEATRFLNWKPDIVHAQDWHAALALYAIDTIYRDDPFFQGVRKMLTVHNLPYNGWGAHETMNKLGFSASTDPDLPDWARMVPLPLGIQSADLVNFVSKGYAEEVLEPELGSGLNEYLTLHKDKVIGIINGIDEENWDPARDPNLYAHFSKDDLSGKATTKRLVQQEFLLEPHAGIPLMVAVSRLVDQKGIRIILESLPLIANREWQFILLGTGAPDLEQMARDLAITFPHQVRAKILYDDALAHKLYAAGDLFLMPSLYEPCGLSQMFSMRYGTLPLARATGGLKDTILDYKADPAKATGFLFTGRTPQALAEEIERALDVYQDREQWQVMQLNAMSQNFSWDRSGREYLAAYDQLLQNESNIS